MSRSAIGAAVIVVTLAMSACAKESSVNPFELSTPDGGGQPETPEELSEVVRAALDDVQRFWTEMYPKVYGEEFTPIEGGFHAYGPNTDLPPCGNPPPPYTDIANNAFYCAEADLIAWDEEVLIPDLARDYGPFTVGIVFAHEYGHAIQFRGEPELGDDPADTIVMEMQADCFAGAWTAWIADGNSDDFSVTEDELDSSVAGMTAISDPVGTSFDDPTAHGSGFDRIGSFQDGFDNGAQRCEEYDTDAAANQLPIVEIPFSREEIANEGNMHLLDESPDNPGLLTLGEQNLNLFYRVIFGELGEEWQPVSDLVLLDPSTDELTCDGEHFSGSELELASGYCQDENIAVMDGEGLIPALYQLGDFAVAAEMARLWAQAAQLQLGVDIDDPKEASLQADCLTGIWAEANFPQDAEGNTKLGAAATEEELDYLLALSAGDLDEAIRGFLTYGDALEDQAGTVFERTAALRGGFVEGRSACGI